MAGESPDDLIEIRTFATMDEVRNLPNYREHNGVNTQNYHRIHGDYWFPDEVQCCFKKPNGNLCGENHKSGFVVQLKDGSFTIIGNYCARVQFGADAKFKADRNRYLNEKKRREQLLRLQELLADRDTRLAQLGPLRERCNAVKDRSNQFLAQLGGTTAHRLRTMARTGDPRVIIEGITFKEEVDENGEKIRERRVIPHMLGRLNGLGVFGDRAYSDITSRLGDIRRAYKTAESFNERTKTSDLEAVASVLGDFDRISAEIEVLEHEEKEFRAGSLHLLCFLVDDKAERYKTARMVLEKAGETVGKERAKTWLTELEQQLKQSLGAEKINIP